MSRQLSPYIEGIKPNFGLGLINIDLRLHVAELRLQVAELPASSTSTKSKNSIDCISTLHNNRLRCRSDTVIAEMLYLHLQQWSMVL